MVAREQVIAVAAQYLDGLVRHDGSGVPLAPDAWRIEQGKNSGRNGAEIKASLDTMDYVRGIRDLRWFVDGEQAIAWYILDVEGVTTFIAERFRVVGGLIAEIEVVFAFSLGGGQRRWPDDDAQAWTRNPDGSFSIS